MNHHTSEIATGGMCVALTVAIMFAAGLLPNLEYAIPMVASYLITVMVLELGSKWAWMIYASTALLGMILVAVKGNGNRFCYILRVLSHCQKGAGK